MRSSSIIRHTVREAPRAVPEPALLQSVVTEAETELPSTEPVEEASSWQERWQAESHADDAADAIVAAAWIQSQQIRRQAQTDGHAEGYAAGYADGLATGKAEGHAEGYAQGHEEGRAAARVEGAETLHAATAVANSTELDRAELLNAAEGQLVSIVIAVARKVVQAELRTDPDLVRQCVQAALRAVGESPTAVLHLNPDDAELLQDMWDELRQRFGDGGLQIVPDTRIQRGGVIVDAENRTVDAQVESRLAEVERQFRLIAESKG